MLEAYCLQSESEVLQSSQIRKGDFTMRIELVEIPEKHGKKKEHRFRFRAINGEIVAMSSEGVKNRTDMMETLGNIIHNIKRNNYTMIHVNTGGAERPKGGPIKDEDLEFVGVVLLDKIKEFLREYGKGETLEERNRSLKKVDHLLNVVNLLGIFEDFDGSFNAFYGEQRKKYQLQFIEIVKQIKEGAQ
jgi:uncharacterized protein YegP (UPF0339 family)